MAFISSIADNDIKNIYEFYFIIFKKTWNFPTEYKRVGHFNSKSKIMYEKAKENLLSFNFE